MRKERGVVCDNVEEDRGIESVGRSVSVGMSVMSEWSGFLRDLMKRC